MTPRFKSRQKSTGDCKFNNSVGKQLAISNIILYDFELFRLSIRLDKDSYIREVKSYNLKRNFVLKAKKKKKKKVKGVSALKRFIFYCLNKFELYDSFSFSSFI